MIPCLRLPISSWFEGNITCLGGVYDHFGIFGKQKPFLLLFGVVRFRFNHRHLILFRYNNEERTPPKMLPGSSGIGVPLSSIFRGPAVGGVVPLTTRLLISYGLCIKPCLRFGCGLPVLSELWGSIDRVKNFEAHIQNVKSNNSLNWTQCQPPLPADGERCPWRFSS